MGTQHIVKLPPSTCARAVLLWTLTATLLFAQVFGAMHRVVHAHLLQAPTAAADGQARNRASVDAASGQAKFFGGHDDKSTCRVFDSLVQADAVPVMPTGIVPFALPCFLPHVHGIAFIFRWASPFDARAPPAAD